MEKINLPKKLFYADCAECALRHHVGYEKPGGGHDMLFAMNYNTPFHKAAAERMVRLWNTAKSQNNSKRAENSPAPHVQQRYAKIASDIEQRANAVATRCAAPPEANELREWARQLRQ